MRTAVFKSLPASFLALGLLAAPALSQTSTSSMFYSGQQQQANQHLASNLIGTDVYSQNNESIGEIKDILVDQNGQIAAVLVGVGGFLGIGEKNVAVPFQTIHNAINSSRTGAATANSMTGSTRLVLPMTRDQLQNAPSFQVSRNTTPSTTGTTGSGNMGTGSSGTGYGSGSGMGTSGTTTR